MKQLVFQFVRWAHTAVAPQELPRRVAIYFHELPKSDWTAFEDGITHLYDLGYRNVSLGDYLDPTQTDPCFYVSFDDNFQDWHRALGLFERLNLTATFYVNTLPFRDVASAAEIAGFFSRICYTGGGSTLSLGELREISAAGHEIGCHSHSHFNLAELAPEQWTAELVRSRDILEDLLTRRVVHFSYPYGMSRHFSPKLRSFCRAAGFRSIASGAPGVLHVSELDPFDIPRTRWRCQQSIEENIVDLRIDGRLFTRLTGRSAVG